MPRISKAAAHRRPPGAETAHGTDNRRPVSRTLNTNSIDAYFAVQKGRQARNPLLDADPLMKAAVVRDDTGNGVREAEKTSVQSVRPRGSRLAAPTQMGPRQQQQQQVTTTPLKPHSDSAPGGTPQRGAHAATLLLRNTKLMLADSFKSPISALKSRSSTGRTPIKRGVSPDPRQSSIMRFARPKAAADATDSKNEIPGAESRKDNDNNNSNDKDEDEDGDAKNGSALLKVGRAREATKNHMPTPELSPTISELGTPAGTDAEDNNENANVDGNGSVLAAGAAASKGPSSAVKLTASERKRLREEDNIEDVGLNQEKSVFSTPSKQHTFVKRGTRMLSTPRTGGKTIGGEDSLPAHIKFKHLLASESPSTQSRRIESERSPNVIERLESNYGHREATTPLGVKASTLPPMMRDILSPMLSRPTGREGMSFSDRLRNATGTSGESTRGNSASNLEPATGDVFDSQPVLTSNNNKKLMIPEKFNDLEKVFVGLESVIHFTNAKSGKNSLAVSRRGQDETQGKSRLNTHNGLAIYHKIKKSVEMICGHNFDLKRMGQIREVFPEAYSFKPVNTLYEGRRVQSFSISMADAFDSYTSKEVDSQDIDDGKDMNESSSVVHGGYHSTAPGSIFDCETTLNKAQDMGKELRKRKHEFHDRLVKRVKISHNKFVENIIKEIGEVKVEDIEKLQRNENGAGSKMDPSMIKDLVHLLDKRYLQDEHLQNGPHPDFNPESNTDDIAPKSMDDIMQPPPSSIINNGIFMTPGTNERRPKSLSPSQKLQDEVLKSISTQTLNSPSSQNSNMTKMELLKSKLNAKRMEREGNEIQVLTKWDTTSVDASLAPTSKSPTEDTSLPPQSKAAKMLAAIRERDRARKEMASQGLTLTAEQIKIKGMVVRIPHILQSIFALYSSQRRAVMPLVKVSEQVCQGLNSNGSGNFITPERVAEHIRLIAAAAPTWCQLPKINMGTMMKINRDYSLLTVRKEIRDYVKETYGFAVTEI